MRAFYRALCVSGMLLLAPAVQAQTISSSTVTPSNVHQAADDVVAELKLLLDANFSAVAEPDAPTVSGKLPRHSVQKARQVLEKVQLLRHLAGVPSSRLEPLPVREVRAEDVKASVDQLLDQVRGLKPAYNVEAVPASAPLPTGRTTDDVFARLDQIERMVDRLDLPVLVPNDVYRRALSIVDDLQRVAEKLGVVTNVSYEGKTAKGKMPADIHAKARSILTDIKALVETHEALAISGGITVPPAMTGPVTPGDVVEMNTAVLAELSAIKVKVGATAPPTVFPPQSAKTPSDTFVVLEAAHELVGVISVKVAAEI